MSWRNWWHKLTGTTPGPGPAGARGGVAQTAQTAKTAQTAQGGQPAAGLPPGAAPRRPAGSTPAADAPPIYGQQLPLVDTRGQVAGFECRLPPALAERLAARAEATALTAHHALLLAALQPVLAGGRAAVVEVAAALLARPMVADAVPAGAWLCVPDLAALPEEIRRALRKRGVRLGVTDGPPASAPEADFIWLRPRGELDTLLLSAQRWAEARPRLPRLATGLETVDDVERLLQSGFHLVGGRLDRRRAASDRPLNAAAHRICGLMNHLALDRDTAVVADAVRADVALSYRLLLYANSPALGLSRTVDTVEQAVLLLGRQELGRWLSLLLLSAAASRQAAAALQEQALARGRLLELLAQAAGEPAPQALFSLGLFSMLEPLLEMPLARALEPLRLSDATRAALLQGSGPWGPYLALAQALERDDTPQAETLATGWGGLPAVMAAQQQAWAWAAALAVPPAGATPAAPPGRP